MKTKRQQIKELKEQNDRLMEKLDEHYRATAEMIKLLDHYSETIIQLLVACGYSDDEALKKVVDEIMAGK